MAIITTTTAASLKGARSKAPPLPIETVEYLKAWMMSPEHVAHPYPTEQEKAVIMADTDIELKQLTNWFVNNRKRFWKPLVEAKLQEQSDVPGALPLPSSQLQDVQGGGGGLRISMLRLNPNLQQATPSITTLFQNTPDSHSTAPLRVAQGSGSGPASLPHDHANNFRPTAGAISAAAASHEEDPHTISASSSACNSDDDSDLTSRTNTNCPSFGAAATQLLDSHLASVGSSTTTIVTSPASSVGCQRQEEICVHILRQQAVRKGDYIDSEGALPTLREVTIKSSVPKERILASFQCHISYTIPVEMEYLKMKVRSRRNSEILRVKKHYLNLYLSTRMGVRTICTKNTQFGPTVTPPAGALSTLPTSDASSATLPTMVHAVSLVNLASVTVQISPPSQSQDALKHTRCEDGSGTSTNLPPKKRARAAFPKSPPNGEEKWRSLCQAADDLYCESLPGLDEAAIMFGFISS